MDYRLSFLFFGLVLGCSSSWRQQAAEDPTRALPEYHDSYIFDVVRKSLEMQGYRCKNLAKDVHQSCADINVYPKTILGQYSTHYKGPVAKMKQYGKLM